MGLKYADIYDLLKFESELRKKSPVELLNSGDMDAMKYSMLRERLSRPYDLNEVVALVQEVEKYYESEIENKVGAVTDKLDEAKRRLRAIGENIAPYLPKN